MNESHALNPAVFAPWRVPSTSTTFCSNVQPAWYCTRGSASSINSLELEDMGAEGLLRSS